MGNSLKRTIKLALVAYKDEKGNDQFALLGQEVKVHEDDVERFDALNNQHGDAEAVPVEVEEPELTGQPLEDDEEPLERPSAKAHLSDWQDYAEQEGVDLEHSDGKAKTKAELIAELSD